MFSPDVYETLRCHTCCNYLSIFPVRSYGEEGIVCGRCPVLNHSDAHAEPLYEKLAFSVKFPCQYDIRGCVETLYPAEMAEHESICSFRSVQCPFLDDENSEECFSEIELDRLLDHYAEEHGGSLFFDCVEFDTVTRYERNYIKSENNDLFLIQMKSEPRSNSVYIQVRYNGKPERYSYCLYFSDSHNKTTMTTPISENLGSGEFKRIDLKNAIKIDTVELRTNLRHPSSIICHVDINLTPLNDEKNSSNYPDDEFLKKMDCPICLSYMFPPIMLCSTGHSFCKACHQTLSVCPLCRSHMLNIQNYALQEFFELIKHPCKNREYNCVFRGNVNELSVHEESCTVGPVACVIEHCPWADAFSKLLDHVKDVHFDKYLHRNDVIFALPDGDNHVTTYVTAKFGSVFKLVFGIKENLFYFNLQLLGPEVDHEKYMLELDIPGSSIMNSERVFCKKLCTKNTPSHLVFTKSDNCVILHQNTLTHAINNDVLIFNFRIIDV